MAVTTLAFLLYLCLANIHLAYGDKTTVIAPEHNGDTVQVVQTYNHESYRYNHHSAGGHIEERQAVLEISDNNTPLNSDIKAGSVQHWIVSSKVLNATSGDPGVGLPTENATQQRRGIAHHDSKRQQSRQVYITITVCIQPDSALTSPSPLRVYISQSEDNKQPGPESNGTQLTSDTDGGYVAFELVADSEIYIGVATVNTPQIAGSWNYEIAASIDAPYHQVELDERKPNLHFVDADHHAALLITDDLTGAASNTSVYKQWMALPPPYQMFAQDHKDMSIAGIRRSYCGLLHRAKTKAPGNQNVAGMTNRGLGAQPKEQFYLTALNSSSTYWGFLAMQGNSTMSGRGVIGGGGKVWPSINFTTKAEANCALMYNLTFCSEVAYAVPANPTLFSPLTGLPQLAAIYDNHARDMYQYFNYSLQQIPCNTSATSQYSLARTCDDCAAAYKQWLCAVSIPRCEDYTNNKPWLQARNVGQPFANGSLLELQTPEGQMLLSSVATNSSRSNVIDDQVKPGPYKEVLPCEDLCYDLVKSCPAALGFECPQRGSGLHDSYGFRTGDGGEITCSYLGAAYYLGAAGRTSGTIGLKWLSFSAMLFGVMVA